MTPKPHKNKHLQGKLREHQAGTDNPHPTRGQKKIANNVFIIQPEIGTKIKQLTLTYTVK